MEHLESNCRMELNLIYFALALKLLMVQLILSIVVQLIDQLETLIVDALSSCIHVKSPGVSCKGCGHNQVGMQEFCFYI